MEKKKVSNIGLIIITLLLIALFYSAEIVIKINQNHEEKLKYALTSKVEYAYKKCLLDKKCEVQTTLNNLYMNGYLEQIVNPISKEIIDANTIISSNEDKVVINWDL